MKYLYDMPDWLILFALLQVEDTNSNYVLAYPTSTMTYRLLPQTRRSWIIYMQHTCDVLKYSVHHVC